eukprot:TRINITY_DN20408_c0_g1_i1.p1 TRINITY_DN20408_c0_g1~~TRINITY_DN20408_c0_g1_i1.p1  ORF type:complete len:167 (-),score=31.90 TRINITY_DN20408_c0_g1_i1:54-554(-)
MGVIKLPDNQYNAKTCTTHAISKALTAGLDDGRFGEKVDVFQNYITQALIGKNHDVGGREPTSFDQETLLVLDNKSKSYFNIEMTVAVCTLATLVQNWKVSNFLVVYNKLSEKHCVYVSKLANGKLCCMNSHGNIDQFPQLKPDKCKIYKVDATVKRAPHLLYSIS